MNKIQKLCLVLFSLGLVLMIIGYFNYDASVLKEQGNIFTLYKGYLLKDVKSEINIPFILGLITSVPSITGFFLFKDK